MNQSEAVVAYSATVTAVTSPIQAGACAQLQVNLVDGSGNAFTLSSNETITLSGKGSGSFYSDAGCASALSTDAVVIPAGQSVASVYYKNNVAQSVSLTSTSSAGGSNSTSISVQPGAAAALAFTQLPTGSEFGCTAFATQPKVEIQDSFGNRVTTATDTITITANTSGCGSAAPGTLAGTSVAAVAGVATFPTVTYNQNGTVYFKASTGGGLQSSCSAAVNVVSSGATKLAFTTQPPLSGTAGSILSSPVVTVQDNCGATVSSTPTIALAAYSDSFCTLARAGTLTGGSQAASGGVATFGSVSFDKAGPLYLKATLSGVTAACSTGIIVAPAVASVLAIASGDSQTGIVSKRLGADSKVSVKDAYGNPVPGFTVNFAVTSGGGSVSSAAVATNGLGEASTWHTLGASAGVNTLQASGTGVSAASFSATGIAAASPTQLLVTGPDTVTTGFCSSAFTVTARDGSGYDENVGSNVTVTLSGNGAGTFYTDSACASAVNPSVNDVVISTGTSSQTFYFKTATDASFNFSATGGGIASGGNLAVASRSWANKLDNFQWAATKSCAAVGLSQGKSATTMIAALQCKDSSNVGHFLTIRSTDSGNTWNTSPVDDPSTGASSNAWSVTHDIFGNIYVVGTRTDIGNGKLRWLVRKSVDDGLTWTTVDDYQRTSGQTSQPLSVTSDSAGNLYVSGITFSTATNQLALVRKSGDGGATWSDVDVYQRNATFQATADAVGTDALGNVYWVGRGMDASSILHWVIRRSTNGGSTWTTVDDYQILGTQHAEAYSITSDAKGVIYVSGRANSGGQGVWTVKKSADGVTWSTIDTYQKVAGKLAWAISIAAAPNGDLYAVGKATDSVPAVNWVVRKSSDGGATWVVVDDYHAGTVGDSVAECAAFNNLGELVIVGLGQSTAPATAIIRKH